MLFGNPQRKTVSVRDSNLTLPTDVIEVLGLQPRSSPRKAEFYLHLVCSSFIQTELP
jgi:hypothetical protein